MKLLIPSLGLSELAPLFPIFASSWRYTQLLGSGNKKNLSRSRKKIHYLVSRELVQIVVNREFIAN
jgi:hypothetical protein